MSSPPQVTLPGLSPPAVPQGQRGANSRPSSLIKFLNGAIFFFLCLFAILLPHSIKGSQHAWQIAFLLWLLTLAIARRRPFPQPLSAPLLLYVTFSGISTMLSPDPLFSWDRMKIVCLVLIAIVFAQNLYRLQQVRTLVYLLILSGVAAAGFTAWQYTHGVGVKVWYNTLGPPIWQVHIFPDDIITRVDGSVVHTPAELERVLNDEPADKMLRVQYLRGAPPHPRETFISRAQFVKSGLGTPALQITRGKPLKAQGALGHYVNFAEILMLIGCLTWAVLLGVAPQRRGLRLLLALFFVALVAAMFLTETRAALAGLALGCFVSILILTGKRSRLWATATLAIFVLAALLWIRHTRGPHWMGTHDAGTSFRTMMWEDGMRMIPLHPWFGVGMETIRTHWIEWHIRAYSFFHDESHFHNDMIQIAVERGLLTLAAWLWFVVGFIVLLVGLIRKARTRSRFAASVATGVLAGFAAYQLTALVHYDLGIEPVAMMLYFYVGVALATDRILETPEAIDVP
jgi:O-antigen ligase